MQAQAMNGIPREKVNLGRQACFTLVKAMSTQYPIRVICVLLQTKLNAMFVFICIYRKSQPRTPKELYFGLGFHPQKFLMHFTLHLHNVIYCYDVLIWQHLKVLKHPALVKHLWSYENSEEFCMVTEPIRPLESVIQTLDTTEIIAGLHNLVEALVFLHERVSLCSLWIRSVELNNYCQ